jgi:hypothetical protein
MAAPNNISSYFIAAVGRAENHEGLSAPLFASVVSAGVLIATASAPLSAAPAVDETPRHYCSRIADDDTLRQPPAFLAGAIRRMFGISRNYALETSYYRCAGHAVLVCNAGANLPCGKANISTVLPQATQWCRTHRNSQVIPMFVTGHDTPYVWRCAVGVARHAGRIGELDRRGFFANYWKMLR